MGANAQVAVWPDPSGRLLTAPVGPVTLMSVQPADRVAVSVIVETARTVEPSSGDDETSAGASCAVTGAGEPAPGAAPANASLKTSVTVAELTEAETRLGAIVSAVLLTTATGPKFALSFSVGVAVSRTRSPAEEGCE